MDENEVFAKRIARYRAAHDMSQEEFAAKCRLAMMTVRNVESGKHKATALTRAKIELVLEEDNK